MSVFRFELVGPKFELKLFLENSLEFWTKGKLVNIPVLF